MSQRSIAFHTFGCKVNQYETEELRHQMSLGNYQIVSMEDAADVYVINSCSVTADADRSCRQLVRKLMRREPDARIVVTGCYAERAPDEIRAISPDIEVFGNTQKGTIAAALGVPTACIEAAAKTGVVALADRHRAYLKVQDGCDAHCTYCIIPSVRSELISREPGLLMREAAGLIEKGFKEIVLTGVRLGRYDWRNEQVAWDLTKLVRSLLALQGEFRIRLSSIEVTEIPHELVALMSSNPRLCAHLHIPLQSGDSDVLKRMGRWYDAETYRARLRSIRAQVPDIAFTADVIVGFPGETEENFSNTVRLVEEEGLSRLHVFPFSSRPDTPAERLPNHVPGDVRQDRVHRLLAVDQTLRKRYAERWIGRPVQVLEEHNGGYTAHYVRVRSEEPAPEGSFLSVTPKEMLADGTLFGVKNRYETRATIQ